MTDPRPIERIIVLGAGAIGGYYGGLLARAGHEVAFQTRRDATTLRREGLRVTSPNGDFHLPAPVESADAGEVLPAGDLVVVCLKSTDNHHLVDLLPHLVREQGSVLLLQNGIGEEARVQAVVPQATVFGGLAFVCCHKAGPGRIDHLDFGRVALGQWSGGGPSGSTPGLTRLAGLLGRAWPSIEVDDHLQAARWRKLCWNVPFNGLCALHDADTRAILASREGRDLVAGLMREVQAGAAACGCPIPDAFRKKMVADTEAMVAYEPSMLLDRRAGRRLEWAAIHRAPVELATAQGVAVPAMAALARHLALLDRLIRADS